MKKIFFLLSLLFPGLGYSQVINTATLDTTDFNFEGKVRVEGYLDVYWGYDFTKPADGNRPYFVSMSRHNEITVNLAYIDVKYSSSRLRARFVPGFGSYINANYATEPGTLKNIVEASAGVRMFKDKNIWIDGGVLGSPYTNESAISKDHLAYTRSFAPEYVPYYLSGVKLSSSYRQDERLSLFSEWVAADSGCKQWQIHWHTIGVSAERSLVDQLEYVHRG